ncbi:MAG: hypothetical protein COA87_019020 [Halomonas sp.]|nr:hypothetical protein [Halomonas sp.]MBL1266898.1 hypothetical protein [Halomonas sp.]MBL1269796.1 hypothetical protein [Halomonas sp.]
MFIFGTKYKEKILRSNEPSSKATFKNAKINSDGTATFDIKVIKKSLPNKEKEASAKFFSRNKQMA